MSIENQRGRDVVESGSGGRIRLLNDELALSRNATTSDEGGGFFGDQFAAFLRTMLHNKWRILFFVVLFCGISIVISLTMTPLYKATAIIDIGGETVQLTDRDSTQSRAAVEAQTVQTNIQLLTSRSVGARVVNKLGLVDEFEKDARATSPSLMARIKGFLFRKDAGEAKAEPTLSERIRSAVDILIANTEAAQLKSSRLLRITYSDKDPERARRIVDTIADEFIRSNIDRQISASSYASSILEEQLQLAKVRLQEAERRAIDYASQQQLTSLDNKQSLISNTLESLNNALSDARVDRVKTQNIWDAIKNIDDPNAINIPIVAEKFPVLRNLELQKSQMELEYRDKLATFKPAYPTMVALKERLSDVENQIKEQLATIKLVAKAEYEIAASKEANMEQQIAQTTAQMIDARNRGIEYAFLQREADTNRTLYEGLLQRYREITSVGSVANNSVSIVDKATTPNIPVSPRKTLNAIIGICIGLFVGIAYALVREQLDTSIKTPEQIERRLNISMLGIISRLPEVGPGDIPEILKERHSRVSEEFRSVRTALQFSTSGGVPHALMVTSTIPAEGKSTCSFAIACMFAQIGMRVILIDADLRKPSLHRITKGDNSVGLSNYLSSSATSADICKASDIQNMTYVFSGPQPPNPAELLSGERFKELIGDFRRDYDLVIIDTPPVLGIADSKIIANMVDGCLLVCKAGAAPGKSIQEAVKQLHSAHANIVGAVLNQYDGRKHGYGYGYDYSYGYGYGYGALPHQDDAKDGKAA